MPRRRNDWKKCPVCGKRWPARQLRPRGVCPWCEGGLLGSALGYYDGLARLTGRRGRRMGLNHLGGRLLRRKGG